MADFPKKQQQCLIPKYLLEYATELNENHPDPSADWGGGGGSPIEAGTGIEITGDKIKTISVDTETIPTVAELSTVAFSGSYNDLSNKPDLSVYELKEDAFSGDYEDLTNKPDLSVYELKADAFSGDYNDLTNKPIIPTKTSELINDSGYLVAVAWNDIYNKPTFATVATSGDYDDLSNKPSIPTRTKSPFLGVTQSSDGLVLFSETGAKNDFYKIVDVTSPVKVNLHALNPTFGTGLTSSYNSSTASLDVAVDTTTVALKTDIPTVPTNVSAFTNDAGYINGITSSDVTAALGYTPGTSNFSGDYDDLTNKPTIPSKTSDLTNDSGYITSSDIPTNYVTTNTNQSVITGEKTFVGSKKIKFKALQNGDKPGFTIYNINSTEEKGYLEYNPSDDGLFLGRHGNYRANELGFKTSAGSNTHKLLVPNVTLSGKVTDYIPLSVNNTKADSSGNISLAIPTKTSDLTNDSGYITAAQIPEGLEVLEITLTNDTYTLTAAELAKVQNGCIILYHRIMYPDTDLGSYSYPRGNFALYNEYVYDDIPYWQPALGNVGPSMLSKGLRITGAGVVTYRYDSNTQLAKVAATGSYNDLTDKPTIPDAVSGTNDGTNWTSLTIGSDTYAIGGGSIPSNMVTTNTNQDITHVKTFVGSKLIKFKQSNSPDKLGFTCYDVNNNEKAYLEYNPSDNALYLGRFGPYRVDEIGFKTSGSGIGTHKLVVPNVTLTGNSTVKDYIPISVNNTKADSSGNISIAVPTTATSTVTPTTTQLVFTYTDNTTETITLMTGASVTTTLS